MLNVKEIRTKLNLSQLELADLVGLGSPSRVSEYENSHKVPSKRTYILLYLLGKGAISKLDIEDAIESYELDRNK